MANKGCYKCTERRPHCHSNCERHKDWKAEQEAKKAAIKAEKDRQNELDSVSIEAKIKAAKKARKMR